MRATKIYGPGDIRVEEVADPVLKTGIDAVVRVVAACVCGSDLWPYRGVTDTEEPRKIGHEFVGIVEEVGADVQRVAVGDFVIAPFYDCDMSCVNCLNGFSTSCLNGGWWDGAQAEKVYVPHAEGSLVKVPSAPSEELIPSLLALSDVLGTGHHAAVSAGVKPGSTVVVVGDGAVGLCAVLAAKRLGAARIVAMSRHESRQALAREFGASDIVAERGDEGVAAVKELLGGIGADCVLEAVGTEESMDQAIRSARPGGMVGYVGVPNGGPKLPVRTLFANNVGVNGGVAPVRNYVEELLADVLAGSINPGRVFDLEVPLAEAPEAYRAMDERRAIKVLVRP
ncbi:zinc-dependent alcohol dehydrogenase family protein [Leucobacter viscericola]|uniref:Zinc-dependent alcohol dehydrogenase family protein n=1 Tax=Leucobacter viscericola TaxID=2714935 RepID=A0A6G7XFH0_9MICO|nr:zinc-dependent alcohol dehydrogenase family protein [Leucobacter viscericola]QIK63216.1 zinc-dependent alcohol dehydrogenase family protein [Leucobacter viscericola]